MKKKILSLFFMLVVVFSCFNNFFAFSNSDLPYFVDLNVLLDELGVSFENCSYIIFNNSGNAENISPNILIAKNSNGIFKLNKSTNFLNYVLDDNSKEYYYFLGINSQTQKWENIGEIQGIKRDNWSDIIISSSQSYIPDYDGNVIWSGDDSIEDMSSRLQLTYSYNEKKTECKINATIKDGAFTDKIYYSNIAPGVSGNLISKKSFPLERYYNL